MHSHVNASVCCIRDMRMNSRGVYVQREVRVLIARYVLPDLDVQHARSELQGCTLLLKE